MPKQNGSVSGGRELRRIRERRGIIQTELDLDGVITQKNYSKIETGLAFPQRETLEAILDALDASFNERQAAVTAFGYLPPYPLPEPHEVEAACQRCQPVLDAVPMPTYLMDFVTRLLTWNRCFSRLQGSLEGSGILEQWQHKPLFKVQFDSRVRLGAYLENMEVHLQAEVRGIRERLAPYREERWYAGFVAELCQEPEFNRYWQLAADSRSQEEIVTEFAARVLQPVRFKLPGIDTELHFYANVDAVLGDDRFRIVYLIPANGFTLRQVERWLVE